MSITLTNPRNSRISDGVNGNYARISGCNFNEDNATIRIDVDYYVTEADFLAKKSPMDSAQLTVSALPAALNALEAALASHADFEG